MPKEDYPKLLNCPFCGGEADCGKLVVHNGEWEWAVECIECGVITDSFDTEEKAIEAWNRRVDPVQANDYEIVLGGFHND